MRKVELSMKEQKIYEVIKKLTETQGNKQRAAITLGCSRRTIDRWLHRYRSEGKEAFAHKNRGRLPAICIDEETKQQVFALFKEKYSGANFTHFSEILNEHHQIHVHPETIRLWFLQHNIPSVKARRTTRRKIIQNLKVQKEETVTKKQKVEIDNQIKQIDYPNLHPHRERCAYMGELIQLDASKHIWFGNTYCYLHAAIDDATGMIVGAYFDSEETLVGYFHVLDQILTDYGTPHKFLTDRRTIFEYKKAPSKNEDTFTQYAFSCHRLGIELQTSSIPQSKGRIERLFQTLQSRLIQEFLIHKIDTLAKANEFLPAFLKKFNQQFALQFDDTKSVFELQPQPQIKNLLLSVNSLRTIDLGHCVHYKKQLFFPMDQHGDRVYLFPKTKVRIIHAFDGQLFLSTDQQIYALQLLPSHKLLSPDFDPPVKPIKIKKVWIPPMEHPFKRASFQAFLQKQKHRQNSHSSGAYV